MLGEHIDGHGIELEDHSYLKQENCVSHFCEYQNSSYNYLHVLLKVLILMVIKFLIQDLLIIKT